MSKRTTRDNPGHRYEPGLASLAREVLKDGLRTGDTHIGESIWAEYLLWYNKNRTKSFKSATFVERGKK